MNTYAVVYTYTEDTERRAAARADHVGYLNDLDEMLVAGAWAPTEPAGGLLVVRASDRAAVQAIIDDDPYVKAGVVASAEVRVWNPVLGPAAATLRGER